MADDERDYGFTPDVGDDLPPVTIDDRAWKRTVFSPPGLASQIIAGPRDVRRLLDKLGGDS